MADLTTLSVAELRAPLVSHAASNGWLARIDELSRRAGANERLREAAERASDWYEMSEPAFRAKHGVWIGAIPADAQDAPLSAHIYGSLSEALAAAPRADAPPSDAERERAIEKAIDEFAEWVGEVASAPASGCSSQEIRQLRGHRDEARAALLALLRSAPAPAPSDAEREKAITSIIERVVDASLALRARPDSVLWQKRAADVEAELRAMLRSAPAPAVQGDERLRELQLRVRGTPMFPRDINPESLAVPVDWLNFAIDALLAQPPAAPAPRCLSCGGTGRMHYVAMEQLRAEHPPAPSPEADHCFSKALGTRTWHCTRCGVFHEKASSVPCKPSPEAAAGAVLAKVREMAARWAAIESDEDLLGGHSGDTETYGRQCAEKWCGKALLELLATPPPASPPAVGARELDPFQAPLPDDARTWSKPPAAGADQGGAS